MSKQAFKRLRKRLGQEVSRKPPDAYVWPGGYPIYYLCDDGGTLCRDCVAKEIDLIDVAGRDGDKQWDVVGHDVNWEDTDLRCDHCGEDIESAYGDPDGDDGDDGETLSAPADDTPLDLGDSQ